jgi:hypothetical protein
VDEVVIYQQLASPTPLASYSVPARKTLGFAGAAFTAYWSLLALCDRGEHELFTSDALRFENSPNPNVERREFADRALAQANGNVAHDVALEQRAAVWQNAGIALLDALHLASAEAGNADIFASTDDVLLKRAARVATNLRVLSLLDLFKEIVT